MPMEIITETTELERTGFKWRERDHVRALSCLALERDGFTNGFSTRMGGTSPMPQDALNLAGFNEDAAENIHENRRRFLRLFDGDWALAAVWQMHSADVRVVRDKEDARSDEERCDALTTDAPGVLLAVKSADCVPVIIGDSRTGACAAIHAGWRGTVARIVERTIERMKEQYGTKAEDLRAAIGPAAGACCYEVGAEVIEAFRSGFEDADSLFNHTREGHALIDLQRANRSQLIHSGVPADRVHTAPFCTMCRTDLFFSYRREKSVHGRVGRLMSVIGRNKD
ncbi:MAG TPA: peptidoglycan editing factor PgeF [Pyrinomonadaceae bacterium]|nr:peptidoglycan editing factor PgeF [Pyrinomonadaceae bacterium]